MELKTLLMTFACVCSRWSLGYNLASTQASIFTDPSGKNGSYFGYSVGLQNGISGTSWLLVGAPRANSSSHPSHFQPGVLYQCQIQEPGECRPQLLDSAGEYVNSATKYKEQTDNAWIGAAMDVMPSQNGDILVCGPRTEDAYGDPNRFMPGICYVTNVSQAEMDAEKLRPLRFERYTFYKRQEGEDLPKEHYYYHAFGQTGLSAHFTKDGEELLIGVPGVFDWTGTVMKYKATDFKNPIIPNPFRTPGLEVYSYLGYSVGSGDLVDGKTPLYLTGAPRAGDDVQGKVYVFDLEDGRLHVLKELHGTQPGESYGAALCAMDVNGDGRDDVLVGAPRFASKGNWDQGRLFLHLRTGDLSFADPETLVGTRQSGALFGSAVACLGDVDNDGVKDFAVGAPFEDSRAGAVYVYYGRKDNVRTIKPTRIPGKEVSPHIMGFGISFSRGLDIDGNQYLDFAVGAHLSGHVAVLRSRPVITFEASLRPSVHSIPFDAKGFNVTTCLKYTGAHPPGHVRALVILSLDDKYKRVRIADTNKTSDSFETALQLDDWRCFHYAVDIQTMLQDFSVPVDLRLSYRVKTNESRDMGPVENRYKSLEETAKVPYATGCATSPCKPDLKVVAEFENMRGEPSLVVGTQTVVVLRVSVSNQGEPAFLAYAHVSLPPLCALLRVPQNCEALDGGARFRCLMANPLEGNKTLRLEVDLKRVRSGAERLEFGVNATSQGVELSPKDNTQALSLALVTQADIGVTGWTDQRERVYWRQNNTAQAQITFVHSFEVKNHGPSPLERVSLEFKIPVGATNFITIDGIQANHDDNGLYCVRDDNRSMNNTRAIGRRGWTSQEEEEVKGLEVDCGSPRPISCVTVTCDLFPPIANQSKAVVVFTLVAHLKLLESELGAQETILYTSRAKVMVVSPTDVLQGPDECSVRTLFYGKIRGDPVDLVVVASSIAGGVVLLILLIFGLYMLGFFKRKRPSEMYSALRQKNEEEEEEQES